MRGGQPAGGVVGAKATGKVGRAQSSFLWDSVNPGLFPSALPSGDFGSGGHLQTPRAPLLYRRKAVRLCVSVQGIGSRGFPCSEKDQESL